MKFASWLWRPPKKLPGHEDDSRAAALGLGDVLTAVPALRAVRRARPGHRLILAGPSGPARLLQQDGLIDGFVPAVGLAAPVRVRERVDIAINMHGRGPQSHKLLAALKPEEMLGFSSAGFIGPAWRDDENERYRWCRLIRDQWGVSADVDEVDLQPPVDTASRSGVVVHPGAAYAARRWPAERWAAVARTLSSTEQITVTGNAQEKRLAQEVASLAELEPFQVIAGQTSLAELAAVVAQARLVLSGDTGIMHLAAAYGTPSVSLFGPTPPALWAPPAHPGPHMALWKGHASGDPWAPNVDSALLMIEVPEVLAAADRALRSSKSASDDHAPLEEAL